MTFSTKRLLAFVYKEMLQAIRDPSTFLIAVLLPLLMIFLFAYGLSLDTNSVRIGLVLEDQAPLARSLSYAFKNTTYFNVSYYGDRQQAIDELIAAHIRGIVIIPQNFSLQIQNNKLSPIQVIADGTETNTASFVENYAQGVVSTWWQGYQRENAISSPSIVTSEVRVWFNPELKSRNVILPGSIAIIMALIGTLLTALVVAREWERGTMEAVLATPIHIWEFILGKLLPYFLLGMGSMVLCVTICILIFNVPFIGSWFILSLATALFLLASLSLGLFISVIFKNQFVAGQVAINAAFLPAFMLSGFLYEIQSMPLALRLVTYLLPVRYFVSVIQTTFLAGGSWSIFLPNLLPMLAMGIFFLSLAARKTKKSLE